MILSHNRRPKEKQVSGQGQPWLQGAFWAEKKFLRRQTLLRSFDQPLAMRTASEWKNVRGRRDMATSENYLTSIKCWFELHSNLKEGEKIKDERAKCQHLGWQPRNATRQAPGLRLRPPRLSVWRGAWAWSCEQGQRMACAGQPLGKTSKRWVH